MAAGILRGCLPGHNFIRMNKGFASIHNGVIRVSALLFLESCEIFCRMPRDGARCIPSPEDITILN